MNIYNIDPLNLSNLSTYALAERGSKVSVKDFATPLVSNASLQNFFDCLPNILAVKELKTLATSIRRAREQGKAVVVGLGGHVIKCGLAPILIDLMQKKYFTAFAMNGSGAIHDFEIALIGSTSEDVDNTLSSGSFGGAEETGRIINQALIEGGKDKIGAGESIGRKLNSISPKFGDKSLLFSAYQNKIPVTIHVAIGTDITHIHPIADGAAIGSTSHTDFRLFCSVIKNLDDGGVYLNLGSAVIMPEVFLKAVTTLRNLKYKLENFTTANFDFLQHYRPLTNVVKRPVAGGTGRGISITGHHEIMIPLLAAAILNKT